MNEKDGKKKKKTPKETHRTETSVVDLRFLTMDLRLGAALVARQPCYRV